MSILLKYLPLIAVTGLLSGAVAAQDQGGFREPDFEGPFRVEMDRVIDGWRFNLRWREGPRSRRNGRYQLSDVHTPSATSQFSQGECEQALGIEVRDFVRRFVRGKQLRAREVRRGRDSRVFVGRLQVGGQDLSTVLLERGYAVPFHDSWRNSEQRRWDCAWNDEFGQPRQESGVTAPAE